MANLAIPLVYLMAKYHKGMVDNGEHNTRPVCTASQTMNMEMSEWVCHILDAALETEEKHQVTSSEEILSKVDLLNEQWEREGATPDASQITVCSLDAEALYPSLDSNQCSKLCGELVRDS